MSTSRRSIMRYAGIAGGALAARPLRAADRAAVDPEALVEVFAGRQTVRHYKSTPVPKQHILAILDAARRGPTCMNQQAYKFLVITKPETIAALKKRTLELADKRVASTSATADQLAEARKQSYSLVEGYFSAPVFVVVLVDTEAPCAGYAIRHDGPIAAGYLMAAARAFGYGTAYLTDGIPDDATREVLKIPQRYQRMCITPIGVPDGWPRKQEKRKLEENVVWETFEGDQPLVYHPYRPSL